jgi:hypothetical protein
MKSAEESLRATRRWSRFSFGCNLVAVLSALAEFYSGYNWIVLVVDLFVLSGLAFFFKAAYESLQLRTWQGVVAFLPALILQVALLVTVGLVFWFFWSKITPSPSPS